MESDIPPDLRDAFAGWLHDLRAPLTIVAGYADLLNTGMLGELTDPQHEALDAMRLAAYRVLTSLEFSTLYLRLRAAEFTGAWEPQLLDTVIAEAVARVRPPLLPNTLQLDLKLPLPAIRADVALVSAFQAFIDPYLALRDATSPVTIHAYQHERTVVVHIHGQYPHVYFRESSLWPGSPLDTAQYILAAHGSPVHITKLDQQLVRFAFALPVADTLDTSA